MGPGSRCAPPGLHRIGRDTNLRLQESVAGSAPLFRACSLQGTVQLQRVEPGTGAILAKRTQRVSHLGRLCESATFAERPQKGAPNKLSQPADS
jgi:hypothetical protein